MQEKTDAQLLRDYAEHRNEAAFRELVSRHADVVYASALRQVSSPDLAQDIAQSVFTDLARKAQPLTGTLTGDASLLGWLFRSTRFLALNQLRDDRRRQARERHAMQHFDPASETAPEWERVQPVLDEAMADLSDEDRDALLLRFFKNRDFRAIGAALGVSDDAAQKRVSRALERLRTQLTSRGVTTTAVALSTVLSTNAVPLAPAGLAATLSTAALAGTTLATTATASLLQIMTTTKIKLVAAVVIAALAIPLAVLWHQNASLRRELAILRASALEAQRPPETNSPSGQPLITNDELRRLRMEHLELLRLRGRVTQLANELRQRKAEGIPPDTSPNPATESKDADSILFSASLTNRVGSGQTLVLGGWSKDGIRGYLLLTPAIPQSGNLPDAEPLTVQSQMVGAPEGFWAQIGWADAKSETRRSGLAGVLTRDQLETLLQILKETKDGLISNTSPATGRDGERMGFGWSMADDNQSGMLMGIDLYPRITADGQSVDFEIRPSPLSTNTPIHPSLKPAGQPGAPSGP